MNHIWIYGGREYHFDVSECECVDKLTEALGKLRGEADLLDMGGGGTAEIIRRHCKMIAEFFDTVFGEGFGKEICGDELSAEEYSTAYIEFILFVNSQVEALANLRAAVESRYLSRIESLSAVGK